MRGENLEWIQETLVNDEASSDEELVKYFHDEGGLEQETIAFIMRQRPEALRDPFNFRLKLEGIIL